MFSIDLASQHEQKDARLLFQKVGSSSGLTTATARAAISSKEPKEKDQITPVLTLGFLFHQNLTSVQN
jgi:hypothetical protein